MLNTIARELYEMMPTHFLYHYTGYEGLLGIVHSDEIWATDIHYFNDSSELRHAVDLFRAELRKFPQGAQYPANLLEQLDAWLHQRLADGHMLFVACFSEAGNLLSQWRGYTPHGNGVSLGFEPAYLQACATAQDFRLGMCIYERSAQLSVAARVVEDLLAHARSIGPSDQHQAHPSQSYYPAFSQQEVDLLGISALLKNAAFSAEVEWRAVSSVAPNYVASPALYRAGKATLIPYKPFKLRSADHAHMQLAHVYLGPTAENNLAMSALSTFLTGNHVSPKHGVCASMLPYRET